MNHSCTIMTRKISSSLRNGRRRPLRDWKKVRQVRSNIKLMLFFFKFEELCTRSSFHLVRLSMGCFNVRFWDDWGKMWGANGLRFQIMETGCCTMTMLLHTPQFLWGNSWQIITWPLFPTLPTYSTWPPAISACSLNWNSRWKGGILYPLKRSNTITTGTKHANTSRLQPLLPKMAKSLGSSYTGPRWLLQRWRW